ncbi:MAG: hypothetical protein QM734_17125 [Cyclobacteriaceae bacterium]
MASTKRFAVYNIIAIICGIWFLLFGWFWTWYANIIIAYPFAIIGFLFWLGGRKAEKKMPNKIAGYLLLAGLIISIAALFIFL